LVHSDAFGAYGSSTYGSPAEDIPDFGFDFFDDQTRSQESQSKRRRLNGPSPGKLHRQPTSQMMSPIVPPTTSTEVEQMAQLVAAAEMSDLDDTGVIVETRTFAQNFMSQSYYIQPPQHKIQRVFIIRSDEAYSPAALQRYPALVSTAGEYTFLRNSLNGKHRQRRVSTPDASFHIVAITKLISKVNAHIPRAHSVASSPRQRISLSETRKSGTSVSL
jgi:hypothetical protein